MLTGPRGSILTLSILPLSLFTLHSLTPHSSLLTPHSSRRTPPSPLSIATWPSPGTWARGFVESANGRQGNKSSAESYVSNFGKHWWRDPEDVEWLRGAACQVRCISVYMRAVAKRAHLVKMFTMINDIPRFTHFQPTRTLQELNAKTEGEIALPGEFTPINPSKVQCSNPACVQKQTKLSLCSRCKQVQYCSRQWYV